MMRNILILAGAIVLAVIALRIIFSVLSFVFSLVALLLVVAGLLFLINWAMNQFRKSELD
jgi:hypothetical protein